MCPKNNSSSEDALIIFELAQDIDRLATVSHPHNTSEELSISSFFVLYNALKLNPTVDDTLASLYILHLSSEFR